MRRAVLACLLAALAAPPLRGEESTPADRRWQRIAGLCRAWTAAEYLHPGLWQNGRDWDAAFAAAAEAIDGAAPTARYREVAAAMLGALGDPATEVVAPDKPAAGESAAEETAPTPERPLLRELGDGVLPSVRQARGMVAALAEAVLEEKLPAAKGLILDLRFGEPNFWGSYAVEWAAPQLVPRVVPGPARRWLVHWGYTPHRGSTSGGYRSGLVTSGAADYRPSGAGGAWRLVILTDAHSELPRWRWHCRRPGSPRW
jgi:hypothetical protein